ncbi:hypothetical protein, partial [Bradyrhizobium sp. STM 3843]|uniref:hypothetical protein n=1 Tax=Bradyrhizobium sp. STM 3843 TaxID=551947 RepID=UPI001AEBC768
MDLFSCLRFKGISPYSKTGTYARIRLSAQLPVNTGISTGHCGAMNGCPSGKSEEEIARRRIARFAKVSQKQARRNTKFASTFKAKAPAR